ncbi:nuclear protein localization protein 4 [Polyplax serrata]|uniref:Nuclear protein localization protein 4 n=1 Tax=Polyplax serrata TaxID=468196 RepID=A0AAN8SC21_POLSC
MVHIPGDASKQVHMEGYQVSGQCMALVRDGCLVPTKDAPELGYIADTSDKKFVPDVFYKVKYRLDGEQQIDQINSESKSVSLY